MNVFYICGYCFHYLLKLRIDVETYSSLMNVINSPYGHKCHECRARSFGYRDLLVNFILLERFYYSSWFCTFFMTQHSITELLFNWTNFNQPRFIIGRLSALTKGLYYLAWVAFHSVYELNNVLTHSGYIFLLSKSVFVCDS